MGEQSDANVEVQSQEQEGVPNADTLLYLSLQFTMQALTLQFYMTLHVPDLHVDINLSLHF